MFEALMIAATGLTNQQRRLDMIANNVSNVNTVGYKSDRLNFKEALYTAGIVPGPPRTPEGNQQKGHGVMVAGTTKDFSTGNFIRTDRQLDVAIQGEGFFALGDDDGNVFYTRIGSFHLGSEPDGTYLVNGEGLYVLGADGERILVPENTQSIEIETDGTVNFVNWEETTSVKIDIYTFRNISGLETSGNGNYVESVASGERRISDAAEVRQGVLEGSNVNLAEEMTRMIRTQRAFQLASRALTTADEMEGIANNMRR